jgi:hypothetical protein
MPRTAGGHTCARIFVDAEAMLCGALEKSRLIIHSLIVRTMLEFRQLSPSYAATVVTSILS